MSEYKSVVQAVDVIRSFLDTHESNSTTCLWESDIDGTILKTDWGYFEEGLDEIRDYCERLDADCKDEPQIKKRVGNKATLTINNGVVKVEPQTDIHCSNCKYHDKYGCEPPCDTCEGMSNHKPKDEPQTEDAYAYDEDDWYDKAEREGER